MPRLHWRHCLVAMLLFVSATTLRADFIVVDDIETDEITSFRLILDWDHTPSVFEHDGTNWFVSVLITDLGIVDGVQMWHQDATVRHVADLHSGESGGGEELVGRVDFPDDVGPISLPFSRPHGTHLDLYTHALIPLSSELLRTDLSGSHIPEPSTMLLAAVGMVGYVVYARRRRGSSRS